MDEQGALISSALRIAARRPQRTKDTAMVFCRYSTFYEVLLEKLSIRAFKGLQSRVEYSLLISGFFFTFFSSIQSHLISTFETLDTFYCSQHSLATSQ